MAKYDCPLSELEHHEFDQHMLRVFADVIPWYTRPQLNGTTYNVQRFIGHIHDRYLSVLHPEESTRIRKQSTDISRNAYQHHWYQVVRESVRLHAYQSDAPFKEEFFKNVRSVFGFTHQHHIMPVQDHLHPLAQSPSLEPFHRTGKRGMSVPPTRDDQVLAQWFSADVRLKALLDALPEFGELHPKAKVSQYAEKPREKIRAALGSSLTPEIRSALIEELGHAWLTMVQYSLPDAEALSLERAGESDFLSLSIEDRIQKIVLPPDESWAREQEAARRLVLDSAIFSCAESGDRSYYPILEKVGGEFLDHYPNVAPCDRPASGVARLALAVRFESPEVIRAFC